MVQVGSGWLSGAEDARWQEKAPPGFAVVTQKTPFFGFAQGVTVASGCRAEGAACLCSGNTPWAQYKAYCEEALAEQEGQCGQVAPLQSGVHAMFIECALPRLLLSIVPTKTDGQTLFSACDLAQPQ